MDRPSERTTTLGPTTPDEAESDDGGSTLTAASAEDSAEVEAPPGAGDDVAGGASGSAPVGGGEDGESGDGGEVAGGDAEGDDVAGGDVRGEGRAGESSPDRESEDDGGAKPDMGRATPIDVQVIALALVEAATDGIAADEAEADGSVADGSATDEIAADESVTDGPAADGPATDGPAADGPATDEPATDEPATGQAATVGAAEEGPGLAGASEGGTSEAGVPGAEALGAAPVVAPAQAASRAHDAFGTVRGAVVGRARALRVRWAGTAGDGEAATTVATRNRRIAVGATAAVVLLVVGYAIMAASYAGLVPKGTTVAGVQVGGQNGTEAVDTLSAALTGAATQPVELAVGEASATLDPAAAGLAVDVSATVDSLIGFSLNPAHMWRHLSGAGPAAPVLDVDDEMLSSSIDGLEEPLTSAPVDGAVEFTGVEPTVTPAQDGTRIDPDKAEQAITSAWLVETGPVKLPTQAVAPEITQEETDAALADAEQIVSGPVTVNVGGQRAELPPKVLASAVSFVEQDGALVPQFDGPALTEAIVERTDDLLTGAEGAQFDFASGRPEVVGGELGTTLADEPTRNAIREAALGTDRTAALEVVDQTPENSTQALRAMGIDEVVGSFSTPLTNDAVRTKNLIRGAEVISGDLIRPGETFSLNSALSPITLANGYVASGMIIGGQHIDGVGGGLSQMATTMFNAAMIAGFEDVEHHPHSYWFERYPAGREATIAVGSKDMRVRNNTPHGAVIQSWVADNELHVQIWSTKSLKNTWTDGPKRNVVASGVVNSTDAHCEAYPGGQPGFTITVGRQVERISDGEVVIDRSYTTTYRPDHAWACVTPEPPAPPEPPEDPAGDDAGSGPPEAEG